MLKWIKSANGLTQTFSNSLRNEQHHTWPATRLSFKYSGVHFLPTSPFRPENCHLQLLIVISLNC